MFIVLCFDGPHMIFAETYEYFIVVLRAPTSAYERATTVGSVRNNNIIHIIAHVNSIPTDRYLILGKHRKLNYIRNSEYAISRLVRYDTNIVGTVYFKCILYVYNNWKTHALNKKTPTKSC